MLIESAAETRLPDISDDDFVGRAHMAEENLCLASLSDRVLRKLTCLCYCLCKNTFTPDGRADWRQGAIAFGEEILDLIHHKRYVFFVAVIT